MFARKSRFGLYTLWFFIGGIIGASAALLLTPTTGPKLQKQLKDVIEDQVENVRKVVNA